ncbi:BadF/BadG/BcrA/BcrD ATPase family protein [Acidianus sp. RZ1]|uniref:BadF/BadG/BcrA/BcrD ATPase family protein n=1 Tax=Acidianus sp. RZ1 TaxID=1540082 RepID=UPI001491AD2D|nr:BadF/BadG/BcrA/BcrD ATPase family protein [Acidianus sp. RZ1]NON62442.1 ATPase [Acidianus sp. RZ1]
MILVGVDAGGTSTAALAYTCDGRFVGEAETGPGNFHNIGLELAVENIRDAVYTASGGVKPEVACIGVAGLDSKYDYEILVPALKEIGKKTVVEHDAFVSLYAETKGEPGIIVISGTGSVVVGYDGKNRIRVGGAGWLLSDEGSGYWIGRKALRTLVKMLDGRIKRTIMGDLLMDRINASGIDELIRWAYYEGHKVNEIASLSVVVDEAASKGDEVAIKIIESAARDLANSVTFMSMKMKINEVYMSGGMFSSSLFLKYFSEFLSQSGIKAMMKKFSPEYGSLLIAFKEAGCLTIPEERRLRF